MVRPECGDAVPSPPSSHRVVAESFATSPASDATRMARAKSAREAKGMRQRDAENCRTGFPVCLLCVSWQTECEPAENQDREYA